MMLSQFLLWVTGAMWFAMGLKIAKQNGAWFMQDRYRPWRWIWIVRCGWLLYTRWNAPDGHGLRATLPQSIRYATSLAEMMDSVAPDPLSPSEAIDEDRYYWKD